MYVLLDCGWARNWKAASSPVGTLPPLQLTLLTTASSPEPVCCTSRFQPDAGTNESIANPSGTVSTTFVVVTPSFSVGTASVNSCPDFERATGGLTRACAAADAATTSAAVVTAPSASARNETFM